MQATQEDPGFVPPRPTITSRVVLVALLSGLLGLSSAFGSTALEHLQVVQGAPRYRAIQAKISQVGVHQEGNNSVPEVKFTYTIGGDRFEGSNKYEAVGFRDASLARKQIEAYRTGRTITVFVDPARPRRAVLQRDVPAARGLTRGAMALLFLGVAVFVLITARRADRKARAMAYTRYLRDQRDASMD